MKKTLTSIAVIVLLANSLLPIASAKTATPSLSPAPKGRSEVKRELGQQLKQERYELRNDKQETRQEVKKDKKDLKKDEKEIKRSLKGKGTHLTGATVASVSGTTLTVKKGDRTYTVDTSSKTIIRRNFWGKATLSEFSAGDKVNIWGKWSDEAGTTMDAYMIRNLSIMKRTGVFFGKVGSLISSGFKMSTENKGEQTVIYGSKTKFVNRKEESIKSTDIKTGDQVRVKGLWDKNLKKITEVTQVKDFSLPAKAEKPKPIISPKAPIVTPTPTLTPTPTQAN